MLCFVCLQFSEKTFSIFGDEGLECGVSDIIEKHLDVKPQMGDDPCVICENCWTKLTDFHDYYKYVMKAHNAHVKVLEEIAVVVGEDLKYDGDQTHDADVKEEEILEDACENDLGESHPGAEEVENPLQVLAKEDDIKDELISEAENGKKLKRQLPKRNNVKKPVKRRKKTPTTQFEGSINKTKRNVKKPVVTKNHELKDEQKPRRSLRKNTKNKESETIDTNGSRQSSVKQPKRRKGHVLLQENEDLIKKHIKMSCEMCTYASEDFQSLVSHFKLLHSDVKPHIKCCDRKLDCPSDILQHACYHEDPEYFKCDECGKNFMNKSGLRDHYMQYHEPEENLPYGCDQCTRRFARKNLLEHHRSKHIPKTERSYFCEICKPTRAFANEYILQIHIKNRHTNPTNICHVCAKEIRDKQAFEKHVRMHFETSGPRLKCPRDDCDSWLKDEDNLRQHLRRFHDSQQYECPQCRRICKNKHSLNCHLKTTHNTKTYSCEECQKSFKSQQSLKEHMAGHSGEALYNCPFCSRKFNSKANMYSHKKKAHPIEWELWHQTRVGSST